MESRERVGGVCFEGGEGGIVVIDSIERLILSCSLDLDILGQC